jgi:hypothetical protein
MEEVNMDTNGISALGDTVVNPVAPPPVQQEATEETVAQNPPPETAEDTGKRLDLYA